MTKNIFGLFGLLLFLIIPDIALTQIKFEKETRIDRENAPEPALAFIDSCFIRKVKWYSEVSQEGNSIEAKAKLGGYLYSIEFDTTGRIQDVEKKVDFDELDKTIQKTIKYELNQSFKNYKIKKVQVQWQATNPTLQLLVKTGKASRQFSQHYELIIKGKLDGPRKYYEVLFDQNGTLQKILEVVERPTSHLDF